MSKRLFKLVSKQGHVTYYNNKKQAKEARDKLNKLPNTEVTVRRGPDHWKGETE
jgi:hypothetical protein